MHTDCLKTRSPSQEPVPPASTTSGRTQLFKAPPRGSYRGGPGASGAGAGSCERPAQLNNEPAPAGGRGAAGRGSLAEAGRLRAGALRRVVVRDGLREDVIRIPRGEDHLGILAGRQLLLRIDVGLQELEAGRLVDPADDPAVDRQGLGRGVRLDEARLGLALGLVDGAGALALRPDDEGTLRPLGGDLQLHGLQDLLVGDDVPHLHPGDLHPPRVGGHVEVLEKDLVDFLAGGERLLERQLADLGAQLRQDEVLDRQLQVHDGVGRQLRVEDAPIDHRVGQDGRVV
mmetsp:Transcript_112698/g.319217  ORF Transcript_112698/g.319217 Transcript_112698/m.319217 type:complete len:287 (-) Transcript_112698:669-1529(-)